MTFLNRIDNLLATKGITRNVLAKSVEGLNHNSFNAWQTRGTIPSGEILAKIADYFGVSVDYLLGRTENPEGDESFLDSTEPTDEEKALIIKKNGGAYLDTLNKILELINESGLEQKEVEQKLDLGRGTITTWKKGQSKSYKKYIDKIADFFNVSVDYLLGRTNYRNDREIYENIDFILSSEDVDAPTKEKARLIQMRIDGLEIVAKLREVGFLGKDEELTEKHIEILADILLPQIEFVRYKLKGGK